ncbi:MAG: LLM class flavin-dependent oxidoreductase [Chloroflexota bacterium]|nr:LLM class flavin-dependent oxidoreductase [Chloroflexota bacterium]
MQIGIMMRSGRGRASGATDNPLRWRELSAMAQLAEEIGTDTLCVPDHLLFRTSGSVTLPEGETRGNWECFSILSALAATTRRATLLTMVACTSFRNPGLLAKIADTVDEVSDGRLLLGLGAGWHAPEYAAYGFPFEQRVSRFEEALRIIVPLLRGETVTFHGQFYDADDLVLVPRGPRPGGPPIWIGARRPRMLGLVAKYADAYHTDMLLDVNGTGAAEELFKVVDDACRAVGRDPATLARTSGAAIAVEGADEVPGGPPAVCLRGSTEQIAEKLAAYAALGIRHFTFWLYPLSMQGVERLAPIVEAAHKL